jgi:hypothetical protein
MASGHQQGVSVLLFLLLSSAKAQNLLSISSNIPDRGHGCLSRCIFFPGVYKDIASTLRCATPVENECYCATETASASAVSAWIDRCAKSECAAGDLNRDITSMRSIYAGYCMGAGFTQPIVSEWFTTEEDTSTADNDESRTAAEPSRTGEGSVPETSTRYTIVTKTADPGSPGSGATRSTGEMLFLGAVGVLAVVLQLL